jgi:hypothetical protein
MIPSKTAIEIRWPGSLRIPHPIRWRSFSLFKKDEWARSWLGEIFFEEIFKFKRSEYGAVFCLLVMEPPSASISKESYLCE